MSPADDTKTIVFLCECGPIIKDLVDLDGLGESVSALPDVGAVERYPTLCSTDGKKWLAEKLREHEGMRPVFAACSPREHVETLNDACVEAGVNPYLAGRANVREQCAWVTSDRAAATRKAEHLIEAAIARALENAPLIAPEIECDTGVLVVGSGVAGMTAALLLGDAGRQVTVVEREPVIGGKTVLFDELYPDMDCAPCVLEPLMDRVLHHPNIEVLLSSEVEALLGYLGNYTARIKRSSRHVSIEGCYGCPTCSDACPVESPDPINGGLSTRKAIHIPYAGALPNAAVVDTSVCLHFTGGECDACVSACAFGAVELDAVSEVVERAVGGVVIATGSELTQTGDLWSHPGVLTTYQFERILNPDGPTSGEISLPGASKPRTIALVHCADADGSAPAETCSRTCCQTLAKFAHEIAEKSPDTIVAEFTWDRVLGGDHYRSLTLAEKRPANLTEVRLEMGDTFVVEPLAEGGARIVFSHEGGQRSFQADIVVMAAPHAGTPSAVEMAGVMGLHLDEHGFVKPASSLLQSFCSRIDGIYVAGAAQGQKNVAESTAQGAAAAGAVLSALVPGKTLVREAATAYVDEDVCGGCGTCVLACPYSAITFDGGTKRARVNELLCHGCGTCAAACPSSAITAKHFTDAQLIAEIRALSHAGSVAE